MRNIFLVAAFAVWFGLNVATMQHVYGSEVTSQSKCEQTQEELMKILRADKDAKILMYHTGSDLEKMKDKVKREQGQIVEGITGVAIVDYEQVAFIVMFTNNCTHMVAPTTSEAARKDAAEWDRFLKGQRT